MKSLGIYGILLPYNELPALKTALVSVSNPIIGFLVALGITMLIQSPDATVGIVQAFALSMGLPFGSAIPLICGAQVGTCITALISSLGTSNNGKRTALINLYYALLKVLPFMIIFYGINAVCPLPFLEQSVGGIGISLFHTAINIFGAIIWIPFGELIVFLAKKTIPLSEEERMAQENVLTMLDENLLSNTAIALEQTDRAVCKLGNTVGEAMRLVLEFKLDNNDRIQILQNRIKQYRNQLDNYITKLSANTSNTKDSAYILLLTNTTTAFGEIGAISEAILNYSSKLVELESMDMIKDIDRNEAILLGESTSEIIELTVIGYEKKDVGLSETIQQYREEIMQISDFLKERHYKRMHGSSGRLTTTTVIADICYTQERLVDYCDIVADAMIKYKKAVTKGGVQISENTAETKQRIHTLFRDKYAIIHIGESEDGRLVDLSE